MIKNINKANELIKQTEKEALEIIKKREFIKSKIVDNSIAIDFIIDCLTKKKIWWFNLQWEIICKWYLWKCNKRRFRSIKKYIFYWYERD